MENISTEKDIGMNNEQKENKALVSVYSKGRENYPEWIKTLIHTILTTNYKKFDTYIFSPDLTEDIALETNIYFKAGWPSNNLYGDCKPHTEAPHQFKSMALQFVKELGYEQAIWCDSSIKIMKPLDKFWDLVSEQGVITFDDISGTEDMWTSDKCLDILNCSIDFAKTFTQCTAGVLLFDFTNKRGNKIFNEYLYYCQNLQALNMKLGSNRPEFKAHRSDQSIISFLIKKHGMNNLAYGSMMWSGANNIFDLEPTFIF
jgi:hypothetical protein